jgi:hypothetical protein
LAVSTAASSPWTRSGSRSSLGRGEEGIPGAWQNQVTVRRRLAWLFALTLLVIGQAGAEGPATSPGAAATAWGIKVSVANGAGAGTTSVVSPPNGAPAVEGSPTRPTAGADGELSTPAQRPTSRSRLGQGRAWSRESRSSTGDHGRLGDGTSLGGHGPSAPRHLLGTAVTNPSQTGSRSPPARWPSATGVS